MYLNIMRLYSVHSYLLVGFQCLPLYGGRHVWYLMSSWSRGGVGVHSRLSAACEAACGQTGVGTRCTCSHRLRDASLFLFTHCFARIVCVTLKGNRLPWKWPQDKKYLAQQLCNDGGHCHHFLRQLARGDTFMSSQLDFIILRPLCGLEATSMRSNGHLCGSRRPCVLSDELLRLRPLLCSGIVLV